MQLREGEDEHGHGESEVGFEWLGAAELEKGSYTITMSKIGGGYIDKSVIVLVQKVDKDWEEHLEELEEEAGHTIEAGVTEACGFELHDDHDDHDDHDAHDDHDDHALENEEHDEHEEDHEEHDEHEEDHEIHDAEHDVEGNHTHMEGNHTHEEHEEHHDAGEHDTEDHAEHEHLEDHDHAGEEEHVDEDEHDHDEEGHECGSKAAQGSRLVMEGSKKLFVVELDEQAASTLLTLQVPEDGTYLTFVSHAPFEFDARGGWLVHSDGEAVSFEEILGGPVCLSELSEAAVWGYSFLGSLIGAAMSLCGVVFLLPFVSSRKSQILVYLHSLAAGVLLALVVVHLIPEAISLADKPWKVSACVMAGFSAGLLLEHVLRIRNPDGAHGHALRERSSSSAGSGDAPTLSSPTKPRGEGFPTAPLELSAAPPPPPPLTNGTTTTTTSGGGAPGTPQAETARLALTPAGVIVAEEPASDSSDSASDLENTPMNGAGMAMMFNILIGDLFHNFFDGVVIALAFRICGTGMGFIVTASTIVHEVPQEISDFIILVESGLPWTRAIGLNFLSSLSSFVGVMVVLPLGEITDELDKSMGLVLGCGSGFLLYIAIDLIPGILAIKRFGEARICWMTFAAGAICVGLTLLIHVHCECEQESSVASADADAHAGHNH